MVAPFEILAVPFNAYLAPAGTAEPDIDDTPDSPWALLGARGADEYDEAGITVTHGQEVNVYRGLRGTGGVKAFRTSEDVTVAFTLNDLTLESYGKVLNDNAVVQGGGDRELPIHQGPQVSTYALYLRAVDGPYADGGAMSIYIPKVFQSGSPAVVHRKGVPAGLALTFTALEHLDAATEEERFGVIRAQDVAGS